MGGRLRIPTRAASSSQAVRSREAVSGRATQMAMPAAEEEAGCADEDEEDVEEGAAACIFAVSWSRGGDAVTARVAPNGREKGTGGEAAAPGERAGDDGSWIWKVGEGAAAAVAEEEGVADAAFGASEQQRMFVHCHTPPAPSSSSAPSAAEVVLSSVAAARRLTRCQ